MIGDSSKYISTPKGGRKDDSWDSRQPDHPTYENISVPNQNTLAGKLQLAKWSTRVSYGAGYHTYRKDFNVLQGTLIL